MGLKARGIGAWILAGLLALFFIGVGAGKLAAVDAVVENFEDWGYPAWSMYAAGVVELAGAMLLLFPDGRIAGASLRFWGTAVLAVVMVGALGTHLVHVGNIDALLPLALLAGLAVLAKSTRPGRLVGA